MPLKKDKKNTETKEIEKVIWKKETGKRISTNKVKNKSISKKDKSDTIRNRDYKTWIKVIGLSLLIINLISVIILIHKINQINKWTLLYNWWIENYNNLKTVYDSPEYKEYILNEINDLKKQLNNKEIVQE